MGTSNSNREWAIRGVDGEDVLVVVKVALSRCAASLCIR